MRWLAGFVLIPLLFFVGCVPRTARLPGAAPPERAKKLDPTNPPHGTFIDDWMIVRMAGNDMGWAHSTTTREGDRVRARLTMHLAIKRAGQNIEIDLTEGSTETVAGEPLTFETVMKLAAMETRVSGRIDKGKVHIASTQFGQTTEMTHDFPQGARMSWGILAEQIRRGLEPGTVYDVATYVPTMAADRAVNTHVVVEEKEAIEVMGKTADAVRVKQTMELPIGTMDSIAWLDADGMLVKMVMPLPGFGDLEMLRADEMSAKAAAGGATEMFMNTLISVDRPIDRHAARAIKYRMSLRGEGNESLPEIPRTEMQTPEPWNGRTMEILVSRTDHDSLNALKRAEPDKALDEFLAPNVWINHEDPEIVKMAKEAAGGETNPYRQCDRLRRYVTKVIEEKNLNVGFATASEVARNREGDCSEHGVLLAALGRALGIPSRVVCGIVYVPAFNEADHVFGFHMWTQFNLGGRWIDFDAAQRETDCNPTHLAFAVSSMKDSSMGELAFPLLKLIGQIDLKVLSTEPLSPPAPTSQPSGPPT